jgi:hypothetical protein
MRAESWLIWLYIGLIFIIYLCMVHITHTHPCYILTPLQALSIDPNTAQKMY